MGELTVEGEHGKLRLNGYGKLFWRQHGDNAESEISYDWRDTGFGGDCVYHLQKHVVAHLKLGTALENSACDYLKNLEVQQAIYAANAEGRRQTLLTID